MKRFKEFIGSKSEGTFAGVRFSTDTEDHLIALQGMLELEEPTPREELHTTLLYSRKPLPTYIPYGRLAIPWEGTPQALEAWSAQDGNKVLVIRYECMELYQRHKNLMREHGATYDFDEYIPHMTLSYDFKRDSVTAEEEATMIRELPKIEIVREYSEALEEP